MGEAMREFMARAVFFQDALARSVGINGTDMQVVGLLMSQGPATPGELATRRGFPAGGSISAVVDRLERAGHVRRERDTDDRRRVIVHANTAKVMETVGPFYGRVRDRWEKYLDTLSQEQLELAIELFTRAAEINRDEVVRMQATSGRGA
jgi:DNA-binding MarR family transcriptional regulator